MPGEKQKPKFSTEIRRIINVDNTSQNRSKENERNHGVWLRHVQRPKIGANCDFFSLFFLLIKRKEFLDAKLLLRQSIRVKLNFYFFFSY